MLIIGENINATNKTIAEAIINRNSELLQNLAIAQVEAGADFIDVNAGIGHGSPEQQIEDMEWLVETVQSATQKPLSIDSDVPAVVEAGLRKHRGDKVIINSINAETDRLKTIGELAVEYNAWVIALAMGSEGIPDNSERRLIACETIIAYLTNLGMTPEQIYFDPLVLPVSVNSRQGMVTLETIRQIKSRYPEARTAMGLSNVSFGLPGRKLINRGFLLMAAYAGLDAAILDPLDKKAMSLVKVADMLLSNDPFCKSYNRAYRKGQIIE